MINQKRHKSKILRLLSYDGIGGMIRIELLKRRCTKNNKKDLDLRTVYEYFLEIGLKNGINSIY